MSRIASLILTCTLYLCFYLRGIDAYIASEISVRASESELRCNQNKWINVSCLHWSESVTLFVRDFCLGCPCPSLSLHVAISSYTDVRVRPRSCNAHAQSRLFMWSLRLGWPPIRASDAVQCKQKWGWGGGGGGGGDAADSISVNVPLHICSCGSSAI